MINIAHEAAIGYLAGLIAGGIVAVAAYFRCKRGLYVEINLYKKMTNDMEELTQRIQKEYEEKDDAN